MKKLTVFPALFLLLFFAVCCHAGAEGTAPAATVQEDEYVPRRIRLCDINHGIVKIEQSNDDVEYEAQYSEGSLNELGVELETGGSEYEVLYSADGTILGAEYETDAGEITFDGTIWHDDSGNVVPGPDLSFMKEYFTDYKLEPMSYPRNTMGLVGLPLRELYPSLTSRWYHIVPVDLTHEGTFYYKTVASNMFYTGYAAVTIRDGKVTVDYVIPFGTFYVEKQCLAWFTNIGDITTAFLENPESSFRYGKPVDIREELKGQDTALLFMCNRVSYQVPLDQNGTFMSRFYTTGDAMKAYRRQLQSILDRME